MTDTNSKIKEDIQNLNVGSPRVDLYTLDATLLGGGIHNMTPMTNSGDFVIFNGTTYTPFPIELKGVELTGNGKMPRPTVTISNITLALLAEVTTYNDFIGAKLTRSRTYKKYLDTEPGADPVAKYPEDIYFVEQKLSMNKVVIEFELKAAVDLEGLMIPRRQALSFCTHIYRIWNGSSWDYTNSTCPYTDIDYYDKTGVAVSEENDSCGHKLFDCRLRFPSTNNPDDQLPMRAFPGVGGFGGIYRR